MKLWTPKFRVAFPQVDEPKSFNNGKPKYSVVMLFDLEEIAKDPEEQKKWDALIASIDTVATEKFGSIPAKFKKPFKKGDDQCNNETGEIYNGFAGMVTITASSESKPGVVDEDRNPIIEKGGLYGGCYAHATINIYAWSGATFGKGVSIGLQNIQKLADGDKFGGKVSAEDDFAPIAAAAPAASNKSALFDD